MLGLGHGGVKATTSVCLGQRGPTVLPEGTPGRVRREVAGKGAPAEDTARHY